MNRMNFSLSLMTTIVGATLTSCAPSNIKELNSDIGSSTMYLDEATVSATDLKSRSVFLNGDGTTNIFLGKDVFHIWSDDNKVTKLIWRSVKGGFLLLDESGDGVWNVRKSTK